MGFYFEELAEGRDFDCGERAPGVLALEIQKWLLARKEPGE